MMLHPLAMPTLSLEANDATGKAMVEELRRLDHQDRETLIEEVTKAATASDVRQQMSQELSELTESVKSLRCSFNSIKTTLRAIDAKHIRKLGSDGCPTNVLIDRLEPRWENYRHVSRLAPLVPLCPISDRFTHSSDFRKPHQAFRDKCSIRRVGLSRSVTFSQLSL